MAKKMPRIQFGAQPPTGTISRLIVLIVGVALALVLAVVLMQSPPRPAQAASDLLPDLGMAQLQNLHIKNCTQTNFRDCAYVGQKQLRFDTIIVNVGAGSFEARGSRPNTSTSMTVTQRIYDDAGGFRALPTTAEMYFSGDGHNHWHLRDLESYELIRLDNGSKVGAGAKEGFCFFDNFVFGSTQNKFYTGCGRNPDALQVRMGLSRGWGDRYGASTVGQYIDITNLTSGRYKLWATADEPNWFLESDDSNNFSWVEIQISGNSVSVIAYGPAAQPI
jgi:Lysyl oxidase